MCIKDDIHTKHGKNCNIPRTFIGGVHKFKLVFLEITTKII